MGGGAGSVSLDSSAFAASSAAGVSRRVMGSSPKSSPARSSVTLPEPLHSLHGAAPATTPSGMTPFPLHTGQSGEMGVVPLERRRGGWSGIAYFARWIRFTRIEKDPDIFGVREPLQSTS